MGGFTLPHLNTDYAPQGGGPLDQYGKMLSIQQLLGQQKTQQLQQTALGQENQQRDLAIKDEQTLRSSSKDIDWTQPDAFDKLIKTGQKNGVSPQRLSEMSIKRAQYQEQLAKTDTETLKADSERSNQLLGHIDAIKKSSPEQRATVAQSQAAQILQNNLAKDPQSQQMLQAVANGQHVPTDDELSTFENGLTDHKSQVAEAVKEREVKAQELTAQSRATAADTQAKEFAAKMPGGPLQAEGLTQQNAWLARPENKNKDAADFLAWKAKQSPAAITMQNMLPAGDALDQAAEKYSQTGQLPAGFNRSPQTTASIIKRSAELHPNQVLAANSAEYKANQSSLTSLQKNFDSVSAFENTAIKNLDQVALTGSKIPDLGARFANVPVRKITADMIGTPEMAQFRTALLTAQTEAAKVLGSANASGVLSDSARHEAQEVLDGNLPFPAMMATINQLKTDFGNRHQSYATQIADIKQRLSGGQQENNPQPPAEKHPFFSQFGGSSRQ